MGKIMVTFTRDDLAHLQEIMDAALRGRGVAIIGAVNSVSAKLSQAAQAVQLARQSDAETETGPSSPHGAAPRQV